MSKKKDKKPNLKKERYLKFKKEKPASMDVSFPELSPDQMRQKQEDEFRINRFLRFSRNPIPQEIKERRMKSKRDRVGK
ncbi:hypothetical protein J4410_06420 [Candidatus Woesearchaeota archaeon]|nr:hypothetical protein [Candidatus Woesearchaeota archaeon]